MAASAASDGHAEGKHPGYRPAENHRGPARAAGGGVCKTSARLFGGDRRRCRGKHEEPESDRGGGAADALPHGHHPDGSAAKLPALVPGVCGRAARSDRRCSALLPSGAPLGFVAILGVLALIGILVRNSVILIVQIE